MRDDSLSGDHAKRSRKEKARDCQKGELTIEVEPTGNTHNEGGGGMLSAQRRREQKLS